MESNVHSYEFDMGTWRITCLPCLRRQETYTGATCLRQPYMTEAQWEAKKTEWFARHPVDNWSTAVRP